MDAADFQALAREGRKVGPTDLIRGGLYVVRLNDTAVAGWLAGRFRRWRLYSGPFHDTKDAQVAKRHLDLGRAIGLMFETGIINLCDGIGSAIEIYEVKRP